MVGGRPSLIWLVSASITSRQPPAGSTSFTRRTLFVKPS
jgi:hypothetical protein